MTSEYAAAADNQLRNHLHRTCPVVLLCSQLKVHQETKTTTTRTVHRRRRRSQIIYMNHATLLFLTTNLCPRPDKFHSFDCGLAIMSSHDASRASEIRWTTTLSGRRPFNLVANKRSKSVIAIERFVIRVRPAGRRVFRLHEIE